MISVFLGRPGSGKSYSAVIKVIDALLNRRVVVTNLPINVGAVQLFVRARVLRLNKKKRPSRSIARLYRASWWVFNRGSIPPFGAVFVDVRVVPPGFFDQAAGWQQAVELGVKVGGSVVVVDEVGARFDVIMQKGRDEFAQFFKVLQEHRHFYASIILIAQSHHQLDVIGGRLKALVEQWVEVVNLRYALGVKAYIRTVYTTYYGSDRSPLGVYRGAYRADVFEMYRSHSLAETVGVVESGIEQDISAGGQGHFRLFVTLFVVLAAFLGAGYALYSASDQVRRVVSGNIGITAEEFGKQERAVSESGTPGVNSGGGSVPVPAAGPDAVPVAGLAFLRSEYGGLRWRPVVLILSRDSWIESGRRWRDARCVTAVSGSGSYVGCPP